MACRSCLLTSYDSTNDRKDPTLDVTNQGPPKLSIYASTYTGIVLRFVFMRFPLLTPPFNCCQEILSIHLENTISLASPKYINLPILDHKASCFGPYPLEVLPLEAFHSFTCLLISHFICLPRKSKILGEFLHVTYSIFPFQVQAHLRALIVALSHSFVKQLHLIHFSLAAPVTLPYGSSSTGFKKDIFILRYASLITNFSSAQFAKIRL